MLLRLPDFYNNFKCLAHKCSDTCCVGWEIDIDEYTQELYKNVQGEFAKILENSIEKGHFKLVNGNQCPFLNQKNLCDIYEKLGENYLCDICTEHPRFVEVYGNIMEKGLGLCCEESANLLLKDSKPLKFETFEIDEEPDELSDDEFTIRNKIFEEREKFFLILANEKKCFPQKLEEVFGNISKEFLNPSKFFLNKIIELLSKTESYGPVWDNALKKIKCKLINNQNLNPQKGVFTEIESVRILTYMIFRYYAKGLFFGLLIGKLRFSIFFWFVLQLFATELAQKNSENIKIDAIKLLSKQLEYSEENMKMVEEFLENL